MYKYVTCVYIYIYIYICIIYIYIFVPAPGFLPPGYSSLSDKLHPSTKTQDKSDTDQLRDRDEASLSYVVLCFLLLPGESLKSGVGITRCAPIWFRRRNRNTGNSCINHYESLRNRFIIEKLLTNDSKIYKNPGSGTRGPRSRLGGRLAPWKRWRDI